MFSLQIAAQILAYTFVFAIGAGVGSFLNVCAYRLPYERSILWPGSHCGSCYQPIHWYDNLPLISYWRLKGRCRSCGARFSMRYFLVELFTALAFVGLFLFEITFNGLGLPYLKDHDWAIQRGFVPLTAWVTFLWHAVLMSFLIVASLTDIDHREIPLTVTVSGTIVGLVGATLLAWPFPSARELSPTVPPKKQSLEMEVNLQPPQRGLYAWPVWYPLPPTLPERSWLLGLSTGLAGAAAGAFVLRAVRFLFTVGRGIEGLGIGDADLMMMAGSFIGWQVVLIAFMAGVFPGLFFGIYQLARRGEQALPFGPSLAIGVMIAVLSWRWISPRVWPLFSDAGLLCMLAVVSGLGLLITSFALRLIRGTDPVEIGKS